MTPPIVHDRREFMIPDHAGRPARMTVTVELHRPMLRWYVVKRTAFPDGVGGVKVRDFVHPSRPFWRAKTAAVHADALMDQVGRSGWGLDCR